MIRISTIFVAICMALIAASLGLILYSVAAMTVQQSAIIALAALTFMILYSAVSMRLRDRSDIGEQIAGLSQGTANLAHQVGEFGRRLAAIESRVGSASAATQDRIQSVLGEINELGGLLNQLAESVAAHDDMLSVALAAPSEPPRAHNSAAAVNPPALKPAAAIAPSRQAPPPPKPIEDDFLDPDLGEPVPDAHNAVATAIKSAIASNRLDLYLQPIVTLPQRKVRFYEAVTRLRDERDQVLTADDFIEVAETAGLMGQIDEIVMLRSVQVLRRLMVRNKDIGIFCNVAAATLRDPASFARYLDFLDADRSLGPSLILEFKQATFRNLGPVEREHLAALAQRGFRFSIDHVRDLRMEPRELADRGVRFIKVPAALLLDQKQASASDIHAADLSDLLGRFGIDLVAERIEGERAVVDLLDYDVRFGQGFLFAAPRPLRPENAPASTATPPAPATPGTRLQGIRQDADEPIKPNPDPGRADVLRATGNAALARRAVRPN